MEIITKYMTKNGLYNAGNLINVRGMILHSVGCAVDNAEEWWKRWNKPSFDDALVHGFIDDEKVMIAVPCMERKGKAVKAYHVANNATHNAYLGFEMCEYGGIVYAGGSAWKKHNQAQVIAYAKKTYKNAVELFAKLCDFHGLDPLKDGVLLSHHEAYLRGMASNHGDVEHIWKYAGLTMDGFRRDVKAAMNGTVPEVPAEKPSAKPNGKLAIDGSHGPATIRAKQRFYNCVVVDGEISGQPVSNKPYCYAFVQGRCTEFVSDKSAEGSLMVAAEQEYLKELGYYKGKIDGFYGPQTVKAKQQFLKDKGYYKGQIDGSYGSETCKADQKWLNANYNDWK